MRHPRKIRQRSDAEIGQVLIAYKNIYRDNPFLANMMLLVNEISEFVPIDFNDMEKVKVFIENNQHRLTELFVRRFKSVDEYAIPESLYPAGKCNERLLS